MFDLLHRDGRFRGASNDEIYDRGNDRLVVDKIRLTRLRCTVQLIRKGNIYDRKRGRGKPCL